MKLTSAIHSANAEFSEEAFLRAENDFLRTELKLKDLEHSLELIETILDCIKAEGSVSSSIETMFGENFTSKSTAQKELEDIHASIEASLIDNLFSAKNGVTGVLEKVHARVVAVAKKYSSQDLGFPIEVTIPKIANSDNEDAINSFYETLKNPTPENMQKLKAACSETCVARCAALGNWGSFLHGIKDALERLDYRAEKEKAAKNEKTILQQGVDNSVMRTQAIRLYERALVTAANAFIASGKKLIEGKEV